MSSMSKSFILTYMAFWVALGIFSTNLFFIWVCMEMSTMLFLGIMSMGSVYSKKSETMVFFLIQGFSSMGFLILYFMFLNNDIKISEFLLESLMLLKMGIIPFHGWVMSILSSFSWELLIYFLTILKFLPVSILEMTWTSTMTIFIIMTWVGSGMLSFSVQSLKLMMMFSSMYFMGMVLWSMVNLSSMWVVYLLSYCLLMFPMAGLMLFSKKNKISSEISKMSSVSKMMIILSFFNMAGMPPFPGFFIKLDFLMNISCFSFFLSVIFLIMSVFMMYLYMSIMLWSFSESMSTLSPSAYFLPLMVTWILNLFLILFFI